MGMACRDGLGDAGLPLWLEWSQRSDKFRLRDAQIVWRSFKRQGITLAAGRNLASLPNSPRRRK